VQRFPKGFQAVVIGASRGIGEALVAALRARGAGRVWAGCRQPPSQSADVGVVPLAVDVTCEDSLASAAATVAAAGGTVSLVMHTPGLLSAPGLRPERRLEDVRAEALRHSFSVNAFGPILAARAFVPLLQHGEAAVFASLSARVGSIGDNRLGGWYAYRAAKAAQNQLIHTLAIEAARRSPALICCTLHPGTVDTGLSRPFQGNVPAARLFSPARAAGQLLDVVDRLTPEDRGACLAWDGQRIPW
jgi:NAD(P)-dependent dehydrogenase (short-subunit alcohol dehydrogenase family)